MRLLRLMLSLLPPLLAGNAALGDAWDVVIRNGVILDGSGRPGFIGDVAIKDGRIAGVGAVGGTARREVEARGLVVAPGFIDVHTHAEDLRKAPDAENFVRMGVTTVIVGNCGASVSSVADFFAALEKNRVSVNVATLIGHNVVRRECMGGSFERAPTEQELDQMKQMVGRAMGEGALGLSTGLIYTPGIYAGTGEIIELAKVAAAYHGIYTTHLRNEDEGLANSLEEAFTIGREAKIPVEISHLKLSGNLVAPQAPATIRNLEQARAGGLAARVVAALHEARQDGVRVTQDLYPYSGAAAFLDRLLPPEALEGGPERLSDRLAEPAWREHIAGLMRQRLAQSGHSNYAHVVIVRAQHSKMLQRLTISQAALRRRGTNSLAAQINLILDLAANGGASIIVYEMNDQDLIPLMRQPETMFASDTGAFQSGLEPGHPRNFGTAARILARYVRAEKLLPLEEAVRRMTSLAAATFNLKDRGEIRKGAWADLVIFDPATVQDQATFASPRLCATGFQHVLVNGVETVTNDRHTGAHAGEPVRRGN